jgi:hypothetical protein
MCQAKTTDAKATLCIDCDRPTEGLLCEDCLRKEAAYEAKREAMIAAQEAYDLEHGLVLASSDGTVIQERGEDGLWRSPAQAACLAETPW